MNYCPECQYRGQAYGCKEHPTMPTNPKAAPMSIINKLETLCGKTEALQYDVDGYSQELKDRLQEAKDALMQALSAAQNGGRY